MRVACVQTMAHDLAQAEQALHRALNLIDRAAAGGADLVVLPECTYPAYFLGEVLDYAQSGLRPWPEVLTLFGDKAREHRRHIVTGLAGPSADGQRLLNEAVVFGPDGKVIGSTCKSFLWHFDQRWFSPGSHYPVFDTALGRLGILICADGRMPEIARSMALRGAQVILDPTAWVTSGGDRATLTNPQFEYMIPVRAIENGAWFVAANKVGLESNTVLYCGRSTVVDPEGKKVVVASPDREEVVFADVDPGAAPGIRQSRRPELYTPLAEPTEDQPISRLLCEELVPEATVSRVAVFQIDAQPSSGAYLDRVEGMLGRVSRQDVHLALLPGVMPDEVDGDAVSSDASLSRLAGLSARFKIGLAATLAEYVGGCRYRSCFLWHSGRLLAKYRKTHVDETGFTAGDDLPVFATPFGRLGLMLDDEGLLPEVPRCLMLKGADTILWPSRGSRWPLQPIARSRADENKVHVALAAPRGGGSALISPTGALLAAALPDEEQVIAAQVAWALSRYKEMAPTTHVVWGRIPRSYRELVV